MRRRGFTYVELLVVIAIIGTLIALLLPAVQACREAVRRTTCTRRLSQLMMAVQNYEMHHEVYPPGTVDSQGPILSVPKGYHHNWIIQILPYLELKNVSRHIDTNVSVYDPRHNPVRRMHLDVLHCPSAIPKGAGYSDYAGVHHDSEAPIDTDNNGVFFLNSRIRYEDLWDGSSKTLFIGEKSTTIGDLGWMSGTRATLRNGGSAVGFGVGPGFWWNRAPRNSITPQENPVDASDLPADISSDMMINLLVGTRDDLGSPIPGTRRRKIVSRPKVLAMAVGGFGSNHPGGSEFACGDGSVTFISSTINPVTLGHLANRADGDLKTSTVDY